LEVKSVQKDQEGGWEGNIENRPRLVEGKLFFKLAETKRPGKITFGGEKWPIRE